MSKTKYSTIKLFLFKHRWEILLVIGLVMVAGFLRLYRLEESMQFLGDQGRDALLVARIFKQGDPVFIGPVTSIGNMYLGPLYYYFMLPWLWLSYPSPLGPAVAVAILGTLTVLVVYLFGREVFGKRAAGIAAILVAINAVAITHSRFSWNPNPQSLVATLMLWAIYRAVSKSSWYWLGVSVCFAILSQLHYMALLTLIPAIVVWLYQLIRLYWLRVNENKGRHKQAKNSHEMLKQVRGDGKKAQKTFWVATVISMAIFLMSLTPLVLFDLKHGGVNLKAFQDLMGGQNSISQPTGEGWEKVVTILKATRGRAMYVLLDTQIGGEWNRNTIILVSLISLVIFIMYRSRDRLPQGLWLILLWLGTAILGTSLYSHSIYDHYILFALPAVWLLVGWLLASLSRLHLIVAVTVGLLLLVIANYNLQQLSFTGGGKTVKDIKLITTSIADRINEGESYNIVLISDSRDYYGQHYRYFLDTYEGKEPINPEHDDTQQISTLVIIDEQNMGDQVYFLPFYAIPAFGQSQSIDRYQAPTNVTVTILRK